MFNALLTSLSSLYNPSTLGQTLVRAAFPKCHMLRAVPKHHSSWLWRDAPQASPCAVASCLICRVPICNSSRTSLGGGTDYGEVQGVAEEIRGKSSGGPTPTLTIPLCAAALSQVFARSRARGGTPENRDGVSDGEQEREGKSG